MPPGAPGGELAQPRRLAVLAYLVGAGERGVLRDRLQALLWPDAEDERGRRIVAQMLYTLRRDLGADDVILGSKELRLNPERVRSDRADFEHALAGGDLERAAASYTGPFLEGFRLPGAAEFERWVDEERNALAHRYSGALEQLARGATERGDAAVAVTWWRRLAAQDPLNARVAVALMQALSEAGDRPSAIRHAQIYAALVEQELELPPAPEVQALAAQLRAELDAAAAAPPRIADSPAKMGLAAASALEGAPLAAGTSRHAGEPSRAPPASGEAEARMPVATPRRHRIAPLAAVAVLIAAGVFGVVRANRSGPKAAPLNVLAIGLISDYDVDSADVARPLADLLATSLARVRALRVISGARIHELMRQLEQDPANAGSFALAAREAGATGLIEGSLFPLADGGLRLDLRWTDLASGDVLAAHTVTGADLFALVDSGTARIAAQTGAPVPGSIGAVTTRSLAAYRLYEQGLRTLYRGEAAAAAPLFDAALAEDSSFAMAAYYGAQTHWSVRSEALRRFAHALRLAERAGDRERLVIRAGWAMAVSDPSLLAVAETLAVRYPQEVEGHFYTGRALLDAGNYADALVQLRRALVMDSLALRSPAPRCIACDALHEMVSAY
ncbi:MAG TPA: BTAD domain-containing putative transcriptional regulator, partial [Longimicrobiales bacterium]|nr:BTAD domain-containing putative transcriptional regulator [Longimicrobiales bacterium]